MGAADRPTAIGGGVTIESTRREPDRVIDARVVTFTIDGRTITLVGEWLPVVNDSGIRVLALLNTFNQSKRIALLDSEIESDAHAYNIYVWNDARAADGCLGDLNPDGSYRR